MVWFRIDDGFPGHPKLDALLDDPARWSRALAVWVVAGCYASRYTTDGRVRVARVARECAAGVDVGAAFDDLVTIGLFDVTGDGEFQMHDFNEYNPTATDVKADREAARLRKQKSRQKKREQNQAPVTDGSQRDTPVTVTPLSQPPDPTQPDPARPDPNTPTGGVSAGADGKRNAKHAGEQLGAEVTRRLNARLKRSGSRAFDPFGKVPRAAGRRWRKADWTVDLVMSALELRIVEAERMKNFAYLVPYTLFNLKLAGYVEKHQAGITPAMMAAGNGKAKSAEPERTWTTV